TRLCNAHTSGAEGCPPVVFLDGDDDDAWNDTAHYLNSAPHRRPSHVALQLGLGLLSLQRARPRSHHHPHPRVTGKVLEVFAARRDQGILRDPGRDGPGSQTGAVRGRTRMIAPVVPWKRARVSAVPAALPPNSPGTPARGINRCTLRAWFPAGRPRSGRRRRAR